MILNIVPIFQTLWQSFYKVGDFGRGNIFVGFTHYVRLINDAQIWQALLNTLIYTIVEVPFSVAIGFIFAVILNQKLRGRGIFRTIFFLPMVVAPAAVGMVWRFLYSTNFGLLNHILKTLGLSPVGWISDPNLAIFSLAATGVWGSFGYITVLFLAGLQEIPKDYYEAADLDGAGIIYKQLIITIPLISPTTFFITVTRTIGAMQIFDSIFVILTRNSPVLPRTQSLVYLFYRFSFIDNNRGYGATIILLLLLIIMLLTAIQQFVQKRWVHYG
ncbi:MAG: sugar ABC transporter permease [Treponema sp.]|nr:sugar ABC transporter permease [Treponema sp.]